MRERIAKTFRREKRRLATLAGLAFLSGVLLYGSVGMPFILFVGLLYSMLVTPAAFAIFLIVPSQAAVVEAMAIARFGVALAVTWLPGPGTQVLEHPLVMSMIVVFCGVVVHLLLKRLKSQDGRLTITRRDQPTAP
mgnify:FL=1